MGFLKTLFGGSETQAEDKKKENGDKHFDTLKYDGVRALRQGQADFAIQCFTHALGIHDDLECRDYLSQAYIRTDQLRLAADQLQLMADAQPDNLPIRIRMAEVFYMAEDYDAMADTCEKAMDIDKDNAALLFTYARACKGQGNIINAIAMATKAISLDEQLADARLLRAELLLKMGDTKGAADDAAALLALAPDNEDILLLSARVAEAKGQHDEAMAQYGKVIDVNPFCVAAFKERGAIRMATGDTQGASDDMRQVLELDPQATSDVSGEYSAEGIESKVNERYKSIDPYGIFTH